MAIAEPTVRRRRWVRRLAPASSGVLLVALVASTQVAAAPAASTADQDEPGTQQSAGRQVAADSKRITLLTGDVVAVASTAGRRPAVEVVEDAPPVGDVSVVRLDRDVYAIPGVAVRMLANDELDRELFNVSRLVRDGYADAQTSELPVIVTYGSEVAERRLLRSESPDGSQRTGELESADAAAIAVRKKRSEAFWADVTREDATADGPALQAAPGVEKIWLDRKVTASLDVSRVTVGADRAAAAGFDGTGQTVAVLDTGIDDSHPDLAGKVVAERSFIEGSDPGDRYGHGTHVASIIAGTGAASDGQYVGVAPEANLINGKVLNDNGDGLWSDIIAGMEWAASQSDVINMSLGGDPSDGQDPISQALNEISERTGALFVTAAGNEYRARQSVLTPAAADAALAVGATTKDGRATDYFSSVGPRMHDWAIKPEISAPGGGIVAAKAGTDGYVAFNGTSMAAPHVAASAALLLQQHPDWTGQQLRDALTSTANPTESDPIWWQGAGVVDVGTAVSQDVHATGTLNLGVDAHPQEPGDTLDGTLTYTNGGDEPVTLHLSDRWTQAPDDFGRGQTAWTPPDGAITVSPATVTVPAGGTATVTVTANTHEVPHGSFYGRITGTSADGATTVRTTLGFTRDVERHQLSLPATDRAGVPAHTTAWSFGLLEGLDRDTFHWVTWDQGTSMIGGVPPSGLPTGRYSFIGWVSEFGEAPWYPLESYTLLAEPEIELDRDRQFFLDARQAGHLDVKTQRPSQYRDGATILTRTSSAGSTVVWPHVSGSGQQNVDDVHLLGSQTTATTGSFRLDRTIIRTAPPITLRFGRHQVNAAYPTPLSETPCPSRAVNADCVPRFPSRVHGSLVDVGRGTPADIDRAEAAVGGLAGRYALLRPGPDDVGHGDVGFSAATYLDEVAARLGEAGVAGIVHVPPEDGVYPSYLQDVAGPPVAGLSVEDGRRLLGELRNGQIRFQLRGEFPSPYRYNLVVSRTGNLPNGIDHQPRDASLAQVDARYHGDTPGEWYGVGTVPASAAFAPVLGTPELVRGRTSRTEYYTPGVPWFAITAQNSERSDVRDHQFDTTFYEGQRVRHDIGAGPWVPGQYVGRFDGFGASAEYFMSVGPSDSDGYWLRSAFGLFNSQGKSSNDHMQVARWTYTGDARCVAGCRQQLAHNASRVDAILADGDSPVFTVESDVEVMPGPNTTPLSTRTHTEWTVHAELDPDQRLEQPAVLLDWAVDSGLDNVVPRQRPHVVRLTPGYSTYYDGDHGPFSVVLWATFDDGQSWVRADRTRVEAGEIAKLRVRVPRQGQTNGFVGYRAVVTDSAGNAIDQTVIRAARTIPPEAG